MAEKREVLTADVLIIGAGVAGLSCALRLAQLIEQHCRAQRSPSFSPGNIYVLEKGRELGSHQLSGAILDTRALRELAPDFAGSLPFGTPVNRRCSVFSYRKAGLEVPLHPASFAQPWEPDCFGQ